MLAFAGHLGYFWDFPQVQFFRMERKQK